MTIIYRYLPLLLLALLLAGCVTQPPAPIEHLPPATRPPVLTKPLPSIPAPSTMEDADAMLAVPKVRNYDWNDTIQPMISDLIQATNNDPTGSLLISTVNNTNGTLPAATATHVIQNALAGNHKFTVISAQQVDNARQQLGLSAEDKLTSRGKARAIARAVDAQYVLYTSVTGSVDAPLLQMQLLLVQSGEIVWSGNSHVQLQ